jgi:FAD/FMN-containing dehydrogenase
MTVTTIDVRALADRLTGPILTPDDAGFNDEVAPFNLYTIDRPEVVVGAADEADVVEAIRFAAAHDLPVSVLATGHGNDAQVTAGLMITTKRLDKVTFDPDTGIVTIGAGVRWNAVVAAADPYGFAPISGSSPVVGAVGFLLGGGLGPLARSHGYGSDYLVSAKVVTGAGEIVEANAETNPDLFWALRGGKSGLGIVVEAQVQLVPMPAVYGGSVFFDTPHLETALRSWVDWTQTADPRVTTSVAMVHFPPAPFIPEPLRGRSLLQLRFAYPGTVEEGERLAAPLLDAAPVYLGELGPLKRTEMGKIHNDSTEPAAAAIAGTLLSEIDQAFVDTLLEHFGPGSGTPLIAAEIRHLGAATRQDVTGGSAAGGRSASYTLSFVGATPPLLYTAIPAAMDDLFATMQPWTSPEGNINFTGEIHTREHFAGLWTPETFQRLEEIRKQYDPQGLFAKRF